jgi:prepilin-type N-terminal cleavage/methylation domain-containing protein
MAPVIKNQNAKIKMQNDKFKILNSNKGFTLIEMMVAVTIFAIIVSISIGLFVSAVRLHKYDLKYQNLLNQTSYVMEYMSRSLRMAEKSDGTICAFSGENYNSTANSIEFVNSNDNKCWKFFLSADKRLKIKKGSEEYYLTSDDLEVSFFNVSVSGDASGQQPKVTFYLDIQAKKKLLPWSAEIRIQTTVSQRNLNQ